MENTLDNTLVVLTPIQPPNNPIVDGGTLNNHILTQLEQEENLDNSITTTNSSSEESLPNTPYINQTTVQCATMIIDTMISNGILNDDDEPENDEEEEEEEEELDIEEVEVDSDDDDESQQKQHQQQHIEAKIQKTSWLSNFLSKTKKLKVGGLNSLPNPLSVSKSQSRKSSTLPPTIPIPSFHHVSGNSSNNTTPTNSNPSSASISPITTLPVVEHYHNVHNNSKKKLFSQFISIFSGNSNSSPQSNINTTLINNNNCNNNNSSHPRVYLQKSNRSNSNGSLRRQRRSIGILKRNSVNIPRSTSQQCTEIDSANTSPTIQGEKLPTSISCDQLNINYISTQHQKSFIKRLYKLKKPRQQQQLPQPTTQLEDDNELLPMVVTKSISFNNSSSSNNNNEMPISISISNQQHRYQTSTPSSSNSLTSPILIPIHHSVSFNGTSNSLGNTPSTPSTPTISNLNLCNIKQMHQQQLQNPNGISNRSTTWSPSKGKNLLQPRTSAPSVLNPLPILSNSHSNPSLPKIGTHHWWGASKSVPDNLVPSNGNNSTSSNSSNSSGGIGSVLPNQGRTISSIPTSTTPPLDSEQGRNRSKSNCETVIPIQRQPSISKWVTAAAPSSPPPQVGGTLSPDQTSPDSCLSPISSMIRIYHVPIDYQWEDCMPLTTISSDNGQPQLSNSTNSIPIKSISSNITVKLQPQALYNYWTQIITSATQVREVVETIANKLDRKPSSFKLCCSVNLYDYLEDDKILSQVRIKKFYLMDDTEEVIIHNDVKNQNILQLIYQTTSNSNSNLGSLLSGNSTNTLNHFSINTNITTNSTNTNISGNLLSTGNLSVSWSPNNGKLLSTSESSYSPTMSPSNSSSRLSKYKLSTTTDNNTILHQRLHNDSSISQTDDFYPTFSNSQINQNPLTSHIITSSKNNNNNNNNISNTNITLSTPSTTTTTSSTSSSTLTLASSQNRALISPQLKEKIKILDNYFHHYYRELDNYLAQRKKRMDTLQQVLTESGIKENSIAWQRCWKEHLQKETGYLRSKRSKLGPSDFQKLTAIGKGGFGKVYLARKKESNEIVTLKVIRKSSYHRANQMTSVSKEKEVMMIPHTNKDHSQWITRLLYSFHDSQYLYLAMEYHCGGDFRALLNNLTSLSDETARFYIAEMILAIQSLHKLGYIHRDLKPSNFVVDKWGHLKLIDFGLSKEGFLNRNSKFHNALKNINHKDEPQQNASGVSNAKFNKFKVLLGPQKPRKVTYSKVGSPEYMAPEMLEGKGYDQTYDYWSLGCVFFEMLFGDTPFGGDTHEEVFKNILDWKDILNYEEMAQYISKEAIDLLQKLLCEPEKRIHPDEIRSHPYFQGLDWDNIRSMIPPFVPKVQNEIDTSYFEGAETIEEGQEDDEDTRDELIETAKDAASCPQTILDQDEGDTSFRSMPFGGFNFQRFPSIVEGARAKGLLKSFYVEEKCSTVSRATSVSSLNSPNSGSCTNSPIIQSANTPNSTSSNGSQLKPTTSSISLIPTTSSSTTTTTTTTTTSNNNNVSPSTTPSPTSPKVVGYQSKTPLLRVSSKSILSKK
ncbi:putative protein serine/threonine kinase [Tieghemostelium lacteum]|uniref:non-specific serine/threonine protein kinase n=1 Tax=Tieghemostelium lacteum TaxID=361077 RepID=A0A151Z433_TIELA|nr:putative protein serine/threonine kinase [Tieghemostelium lacteum]|eukprot:KYQ88701.1 putative protein serine/threonine kinase [Tieghemostelium lacteum]